MASRTDAGGRSARPCRLELQVAADTPGMPPPAEFERWADAALENESRRELVIRIVDRAESQALNRNYRGKDRPTNVLSFPFDAPPEVPSEHLGDLVICAPVVEQEARDQNKPPLHHWAHMVIHGVLHLRGYDHIDPAGAETMETKERALLARFGIPDPYREVA